MRKREMLTEESGGDTPNLRMVSYEVAVHVHLKVARWLGVLSVSFHFPLSVPHHMHY